MAVILEETRIDDPFDFIKKYDLDCCAINTFSGTEGGKKLLVSMTCKKGGYIPRIPGWKLIEKRFDEQSRCYVQLFRKFVSPRKVKKLSKFEKFIKQIKKLFKL